ncbi:GntR family transcriptional regulator [Sediminispirochaeta smaragdinae]|jgi:GntR family transcriptional regulator|uniref:Transcriptional regulator, GntR family n=1 Tax=Sediminispirochaeta smaragdinae (strain DSM 11293 / JCM 15392 / SEBR 4228) TaxID=573413 RepID=E1RB62_SEDSS|nr:GntR family transcriptional regulator [Sediminispirochaeta smaragdinae]ADK79592.1 transcriptional regulator, GntR family [Sediminispirochaeta smaragdinae DSM 11293]
MITNRYSRLLLVRQALLELIQTLPPSNGTQANRLPPEGELARKLGVSVATVREALRMLEREGIVSKRHGAGNFYHSSALDLSMRIDTNLEFTELIQAGGYEVGQRGDRVVRRAPDKEERKWFGIEGEHLCYHWRYLADGHPAILTTNLIPACIITNPPETEEADGNILNFLWKYAGQKISHANVCMEPQLAEEADLAAFEASNALPIIVWYQRFFSYQDRPVGYVRVAFNPLIVKMQLLQKWL